MFVVERIDVSQFIDAVLVLRTHAANLTGGVIQVFLSADGFTEDDPDLIFVPATPLISLNVTSPAPQLSTQLTTIRGHYATLGILGQRNSANPLSATVSVDLVLRNPDDRGRAAGGRFARAKNGGAKKNGCDCPGGSGAPCDCKGAPAAAG
jgi:hypothetical protein